MGRQAAIGLRAMSSHIHNRGATSWDFGNFSAFRSDYQYFDGWQLARESAVTDCLTVIFRYFIANPDERRNFIRKGFVASAIFKLYTRKINPMFSAFQNQIFDFEVAALDMTDFKWFYVFPST